MANEVQEVEAGARINHPVFRDVYNTTFDKDVILDFEILDDGSLSGMCQTENYGWLPVFYHCKKGCYAEDVPSLLENNSLKNGILAFAIGDEVKVLIEEETPKYVVGHFEQHNPPLMCMDLIKMSFFNTIGSDYTHTYICSEREELEDGIDCHGDTPVCEVEEIILAEWMADRIFEFFGEDVRIVDCQVDRLIKVGPMMLILTMDGKTIYRNPSYPDHDRAYTRVWGCYKAAWTQEREDELIALGAAVDVDPDVGYDPITYPDYCVHDNELRGLINHGLAVGEFIGWYYHDGVDCRTIIFKGEGVIEE